MKRKFAQKGIVYKQSYENEATGNPVILENICSNCVPNVSISFSPIQTGEGNPSPENIRPISGWDSLWVTRCGKNLLDYAQLTGGRINYGLTSEKIGGNVIRVSGTATSTGNNLSFAICDSAQTSLQGKGYAIFVIPISGTEKLKSAYGLRHFGESDIAIIADLVEGESYDMRFNLMITADNSTPTAYAPYTGTTHTLTLPETIYGGTVDAVTGEGWQTVDVISLAVADMNNSEMYPGWINQNWVGEYVEKVNQDSTFVTKSDYLISNADGSKMLRFNNNIVYFEESVLGHTQSEMKSLYPDLVFQFAFKRLSPTPFQATGGQSIPALDGVNTFYTNGDEVKFNCTILANPQPCNY